MTDTPSSTTRPDEPTPETTPATTGTDWQRLVIADPIAVRDPLAELLGMVDEGDPLVVTFAEVATAAGHACPAVSGAYRATQLALDDLYPTDYPVRSDVAVTVYGSPGDPGLGPMADTITHITGAAGETGFHGLGGHGGRTNLRTFDPETDTGPGRTFDFTRTDTDETVRVTFSPDAIGIQPGPDGDGPADTDGPGPAALLPKIAAGDATDEERERFYDTWHGRVQHVLESDPGPDSPFAVERITIE